MFPFLFFNHDYLLGILVLLIPNSIGGCLAQKVGSGGAIVVDGDTAEEEIVGGGDRDRGLTARRASIDGGEEAGRGGGFGGGDDMLEPNMSTKICGRSRGFVTTVVAAASTAENGEGAGALLAGVSVPNQS